MSLNDSITSLANATVTIRRTSESTFVNGKYVKGAPTLITGVRAVVQPAYNLNRVIGGADIEATVDNQRIAEVYQIHLLEKLYTVEEDHDPDVILWRDSEWTVIRVEEWEITGEIHYHAVITKVTRGAS